MKLKILIVVNQIAGKRDIKKHLPQIINNLEKANCQTQIKYTSIENDAGSIIKNYDEYCDMILVCGGDGTLSQAIHGIYKTNKKIPIGYIPVGTMNDFARSLGIPFDKFHVSKNINKYSSKKIDLGLIDNQAFNYVVAFGIFSKSSYSTNDKLKQTIGKSAYILSSLKEIFNYKTYKLQIQTEKEIIEDEFLYGSISNSKYIGGFNLLKKKEVKFDDGKFEAIFVKRPKSFFKTLILILKVLRGDLEDDNIYYFQTSELNIKCNQPMDLSIDGEYGGAKSYIKIQVKNKCLEYLVPSNV